jgi:hypothetical protein
MVARRQIGTQEKIQKSNWQDSECSCGTEQRDSSSRRQNAEEANPKGNAELLSLRRDVYGRKKANWNTRENPKKQLARF